MNYRRIPARKPTMMVTAAVIAMLTMVLVAIPVGSDSVKQLVHNFVVASGQSVATGDVVGFLNGYVQKGFVPLQVFNPATTTDISVAKLSSTKFVLAYTDEGNSKKGTAVVADVSGNIVAYGSKYVFNSAWTLEISVAALSSTKFVIVYRDESNSGSSTAVIGDVSGNTITFGSEYVFNSGSTVYISVAALSSTKFVAAYRDYGNSSYGTAIIGDISGTTITYGSESVFNSSNTGWTSVAALTSTRFVVAFSDFSTQLKGITRFGDVSGNTITYGVNFAFNTYDTEYTSVTALSSAKFVVAYKDAGNSDKGTARIGEISGSAILISPAYVFNIDQTDYISVAALSSTKFVVSYRDVGNSNKGQARIGDVSGIAPAITITYGPAEYAFNSSNTEYISVAAISSTRFVVAYKDGGNSNKGTALIGDVSGTTMTFPLPIVHLIGIAKQSGTAGQSVAVIIAGVSNVHSNLTLDTIYYSSKAGALTTTVTDYKIGRAISGSEILLSLSPP